MLTLLTYFGVIVAGIAGTISVLTDYRDRQTHKLTRWGVIAIVFIALSSSISLVATYRSKQEAAAAAAASLQEEVKRQTAVLEQIRGMSFGLRKEYRGIVTVAVPTRTDLYQNWRATLERARADQTEGAPSMRTAARQTKLAILLCTTALRLTLKDPDKPERFVRFLGSTPGGDCNAPNRNQPFERPDSEIQHFTSDGSFTLYLTEIGNQVASLADFLEKRGELEPDFFSELRYVSVTIFDDLGRSIMVTDLKPVSTSAFNPNAVRYSGFVRPGERLTPQ